MGDFVFSEHQTRGMLSLVGNVNCDYLGEGIVSFSTALLLFVERYFESM